MNLKSFFNSLLPSFERSRIVEDIELIRKEVVDVLFPALKTAITTMAGKSWSDNEANAFNSTFTAALPQFRREGFLGGAQRIFSDLPAKLDAIDKMVIEIFAKDVTKDTITYRKAAILQYLDTVRFAVKFTGRQLLRLTALETAALNRAPFSEPFAPAETAWLKANEATYLQVMKLLAQHPKDLAALLEEIPDIAVVPDRVDLVKQTVGLDKIDPLKMNFLPPNLNPFYSLRLLYTEYQVKRYEIQVEEKRLLELRLLAMKEAMAGKQDPRLAQQIEYTEGRLQRLGYKISEMEKHAA